jgi:hypothetical protein
MSMAFGSQSKSPGRTRVANGSTILPGVDGRGLWARRCKETLVEIVNDLGGWDYCSSAERAIARRAAVLMTELERLEIKFANAGEALPDELDLYSRVSNTLRRHLEAVGLERRQRAINPPTIAEYLDHVANEAPE